MVILEVRLVLDLLQLSLQHFYSLLRFFELFLFQSLLARFPGQRLLFPLEFLLLLLEIVSPALGHAILAF